MKLKSLFEVIFKVLGVYLIIKSLVYLPQLIGVFSPSDTFLNTVFYLITLIASFLILVLIGLLLITNAERITMKIIPEQRLKEDFTTFKIHRSTVLTISVIVLGGLILVDEIPRFFMNFFENYNQFRIMHSNQPSLIYQNYMVYSFVKILIGLYLIYYNKNLVLWVEKKRKP